MAAAWQEGGEWGKCFGLLGSPGACGAVPKGSPGGGHCVLFLVAEPGTAQVPGGTSFGVERRAGSSCMVFPFHLPVPSHSPTPVLPSQYQL